MKPSIVNPGYLVSSYKLIKMWIYTYEIVLINEYIDSVLPVLYLLIRKIQKYVDLGRITSYPCHVLNLRYLKICINILVGHLV